MFSELSPVTFYTDVKNSPYKKFPEGNDSKVGNGPKV